MQKSVVSALAILGLVLASCGMEESGAEDLAGSTTGEQTTETVASSSTTMTTAQVTPTTAHPPGLSVQTALLAHGFDECVSPETVLVDRIVDGGADPMFAAFDLLVSGPSGDETKDGAASWFAGSTAGTVRSVTLDRDLLIVDFGDFRETIANASTSCGSGTLLAQLNATAFQFAEVQRVTYQIEGNCDTFFNWLQRDCREYLRT